MMRIPLYHVDAFTNQPFRGNPAAVCPLNEWLDDELLPKVAAENALSATAFFLEQGTRYELRWFTPACELRLCGHATLATAYVLLNHLRPGLEVVQFETRRGGSLWVRKDGEFLAMDFPALVVETCESLPDALERALGTDSRPMEVIEANDTYIAVYESQSAVEKIRPNFALLERLHPLAVAVTAPAEEADFVLRYFAPSYGIPEDPVTGSIHCLLAPYWAARLGKSHLHARQLSERGGELWCEIAGQRVSIRGSAVLILQGSLVI